LSVLRERGLSVPSDVSVVGFDDMPIARDVTPRLTTVRLPLVEIGARAITLALEAPQPSPRVEEVSAEVIHRESLAAPRDE
jgi:LacI family transcriptional regulator